MSRYMTRRSTWKPTGTWEDFTVEGLREVLRRSPQEIQGDKIAQQKRPELKSRLARALWGTADHDVWTRHADAVRKAFDEVRRI